MTKHDFYRYTVTDHDRVSTVTCIIEQIKNRNRKNEKLLNRLQFDWPESSDIIKSLYEYISCRLAVDGDPVIYRIIEAALIKYSDVAIFSNGSKQKDYVRIAAFIDSLISETCLYLGVDIMDGNRVWNVKSGTPFLRWCEDSSGAFTANPRPHENVESLRSVLYQRITSKNIKNLLLRVRYEEAVVAGRMAPGA